MPDGAKLLTASLLVHIEEQVGLDNRKRLKALYKRLLQEPIGVTSEGKLVIHGDILFKQQDELGIPLSIQLMTSFNCEYFQVNWIEYLDSCHKAGRKKKSTLLDIGNSLADSWGVDYKDTILPACQWYADKLWKE